MKKRRSAFIFGSVGVLATVILWPNLTNMPTALAEPILEHSLVIRAYFDDLELARNMGGSSYDISRYQGDPMTISFL